MIRKNNWGRNLGGFIMVVTANRESESSSLRTYINLVREYPLLTKEEEEDLAIKKDEGDGEAFDLLVKSNLRLVLNIGKRYRGLGVSYLDIIQEGNIGLIKAVEKFEISKGMRLSTYATWWIRSNIQTSLHNTRRTIRLPYHRSDALYRITRKQDEWVELYGKLPTIEELSKELKMKEYFVREMIEYKEEIISLNQEVGEGEETTLMYFIEDKDTPLPDSVVIEREQGELIREILRELTDREMYVVMERYGINDGIEKTLKEIGNNLGVTGEAIRRVEVTAMRKLKHSKFKDKWEKIR